MFDLINGIPLHVLVVHAIVVLLPLATLGTIAIAVKPVWRTTYGPLVVAAAAIATVLMPVATSSGEALERRVGSPGEHAELGDSLIFFAIPLLILSLAMVVIARRNARADKPDWTWASPTVLNVIAALAVVAGLASAVQVYRVGDSGARAAWEDATTSSAAQ